MLLVVLPEDLVLRATVQQTETLRLDCADNCKSAHNSVLVKNLCDWKLKFPEKAPLVQPDLLFLVFRCNVICLYIPGIFENYYIPGIDSRFLPFVVHFQNSFNALVVPAVTVKNEYKNLRNWNAWSIQNILADLCIPSISGFYPSNDNFNFACS